MAIHVGELDDGDFDHRHQQQQQHQRQSGRGSFVADPTHQRGRRRSSASVTATPLRVRRNTVSDSVDRVDVNVGGVPLTVTDKTSKGLLCV